MQPAQPAKRTVEARRIKAADVDPAVAHAPPVGVAGFREAAHPIVDHPDRYAFRCLGDERFRKPLADFVIANNIVFKMALEDEGFEVDVYNDSLLALSNFKDDLYDLVILDINIPKMNGYKL